jgi:hypothetical protein
MPSSDTQQQGDGDTNPKRTPHYALWIAWTCLAVSILVVILAIEPAEAMFSTLTGPFLGALCCVGVSAALGLPTYLLLNASGRPGKATPLHFRLRVAALFAGLTVTGAAILALAVLLERPEQLRMKARSALDEAGWRIVSAFDANLVVGSPEHVSEEMIRHLSRLESPTVLIIDAPEFNNRMLAMLGEAGALSETFFLKLNGTQISDGAVATLERMPELELLDVSGTRLTDGGLWQLRKASALERIAVGGTRVTEEGIDRFLEARADVEVEHGPLNEEDARE